MCFVDCVDCVGVEYLVVFGEVVYCLFDVFVYFLCEYWLGE